MINAKPSRNETPNATPSGSWHEISAGENDPLPPHTISAVNRLPETEQRKIFTRLVPPGLVERFNLDPSFRDADGNDLLHINSDPSGAVAEMALYHQFGFPDPLLYGQITDTLNGQVHVLLYILNDPESPRFDVDRMPDGSPTHFGTAIRNLEAETAALQAGLAPGQIRLGLGLLGQAIEAFEQFVLSLGQELYFAEPLYYHNAVIFERHGFSYAQGKNLMERIQAGFSNGGDLLARLDGSSPFRLPAAAHSIRLRSWAIHDMLLGEAFSNVTVFKKIGSFSGINTCPGVAW